MRVKRRKAAAVLYRTVLAETRALSGSGYDAVGETDNLRPGFGGDVHAVMKAFRPVNGMIPVAESGC